MGGVYTKLFNKKLWKAPEDKVFIFASLAEKTEKKSPPPWGFSLETPVVDDFW